MSSEFNRASWVRIHSFLDWMEEGAELQVWVQSARRVVGQLELMGLPESFQIGQSMHHIILSTLDHPGVGDDLCVTLEFTSRPLVRVAFGRGNLHFCEPQEDEQVAVERCLIPLRRLLLRLWRETRPCDPVPACFTPSSWPDDLTLQLPAALAGGPGDAHCASRFTWGTRCGFLLGGVAGGLGFVLPVVFTPEANQGPMLGIFITGPLGFLLGAILGAIFAESLDARFSGRDR